MIVVIVVEQNLAGIMYVPVIFCIECAKAGDNIHKTGSIGTPIATIANNYGL